MPNTASESPHKLRAAILYKDLWIGCFFLHCSENTNVVWTLDPRLTPAMYWFRYETQELATARYSELIAISIKNGWKLHFNGSPNNPQHS